jgi:quinolinate synthase
VGQVQQFDHHLIIVIIHGSCAVHRRINSQDEIALKHSIPNSLLFLYEELPELIEAAKDATTVHVHLLGAAFPTEGRADFRLLKRLLQPLLPAMTELRVLLNIPTP